MEAAKKSWRLSNWSKNTLRLTFSVGLAIAVTVQLMDMALAPGGTQGLIWLNALFALVLGTHYRVYLIPSMPTLLNFAVMCTCCLLVGLLISVLAVSGWLGFILAGLATFMLAAFALWV